MRRVRWISLALTAVVLALLARLLWNQRDQLLSYPWQVHWPWLVFASLMHASTMGWSFLVWHLSLRRLAGRDGPSLRTNFVIYYPTLLARRVPGTVWYAAGRVWLYEQQGVARPITLVALALESAIIFLAGVLFFAMLLPFIGPGDSALTAWLASIPPWLALLGIVGALVVIWPGLLEWVMNWLRRRMGLPPLHLGIGYRDLLGWLGLTLIVWLTAGLGFYGIVNVVYPAGTDLLPAMLFIHTTAVLLGIVSFLVPVLPLVKEVTMTVLLAAYMPLPVTIVVAILYRVWWTLNDAAWALGASQLGQPPAVPEEAKVGPTS